MSSTYCFLCIHYAFLFIISVVEDSSTPRDEQEIQQEQSQPISVSSSKDHVTHHLRHHINQHQVPVNAVRFFITYTADLLIRCK